MSSCSASSAMSIALYRRSPRRTPSPSCLPIKRLSASLRKELSASLNKSLITCCKARSLLSASALSELDADAGCLAFSTGS